MKVQRVYVDTSVLGGCFDPEFAAWSNALVRDFRNGQLALVLSDVVAAEVADAPPAIQRLYAGLMPLGPEILAVDVEALLLADAYQARGILTPRFYNDGLHIALATVAAVDLLVSWNFKHVVRYDRIRQFNAVNLEQGYKPLSIFSPREVATYDQES